MHLLTCFFHHFMMYGTCSALAIIFLLCSVLALASALLPLLKKLFFCGLIGVIKDV